MKILSGTAKCEKHGEYEWQTFRLDRDERVIGRFVPINVKRAVQLSSNKMLIVSQCPACGKAFEIEKDI